MRERQRSGSLRLVHKYFNSRSREGATQAIRIARAIGMISIHAPVRERHIEGRNFIKDAEISIHAPVRERHVQLKGSLRFFLISIHAPVRERHGGDGGVGLFADISIHAPVRERHSACHDRRQIHPHFNSRSREGATQGGQSTLIYKKMALSIAEVYPIQLSKNRKLFETMSIHCTQNRLYNTHTCRRKGGRLRFALVKS